MIGAVLKTVSGLAVAPGFESQSFLLVCSSQLMGDMTRYMKQTLAISGTIILLYLFRKRKLMEDDIEIPEFMRPHTCDEPGCMKRAIPKVGKCLECAFEDALPKLWDDLEEITRVKK